MWIFSKFGFYSVVQDFNSKELLHIRARVSGDLERLLSAGGVATSVTETPDADYRYRAAVSRADFEQLLVKLGDAVDYPNFKSAVAKHADQAEKLDAYHEVWRTMRGLQP